MDQIIEFFKHATNPEHIIATGGIFLLIAIIFAETGLFFGFFFPGDSLLFTAGLLCGSGVLDVNIFFLLTTVSLAGIIGNFVGYFFGRTVGARLFNKEDSLIFKKKYMTMTENFYQRHGAMALIGGRFLPIIRTFVPILAGMIKLDFKKFVLYNILGAILWVFSFTLAGFSLVKIFPDITKYLHYIIIGLIIITLIPVIKTYLKERKLHAETEKADNAD